MSIVFVEELALVVIQFGDLNHVSRSVSLRVLIAGQQILYIELVRQINLSDQFLHFFFLSWLWYHQSAIQCSWILTLMVDVPRPIYFQRTIKDRDIN
jgi:hypothetical protein